MGNKTLPLSAWDSKTSKNDRRMFWKNENQRNLSSFNFNITGD